MSHFEVLDVIAAHPEIPTSFVTDSGTAVPVANTLNIFGGTDITTSGAGNTVTISFTGAIGVETLTGDDSVVVTPLAGNINLFGNVVANATHAKAVFVESPVAHEERIDVQLAAAIVATDVTKVGLAAFNSAQFTVDANGFVSTNGASIPETLTGNSGGAVGPTAGNINTVGTGSITIAGNPGTSTLTTQLTGLTQYNVLVGQGSTTIGLIVPNTSGYVLTSNGGAAYPTFQAVSASGAIITIDGDSGSISPSAGVVTIYANNASLGAGQSVEFINSGTISTLQVTDSNHNTIIGSGAGKLGQAYLECTALGYQAGASMTSGSQQTLIGYQAGTLSTTGTNTLIGAFAGSGTVTGNNFVAIGYNALVGSLTGANIISIGQSSGGNYISSESNNIVIGSNGITSESNAIHIGTQGSGAAQQNKCYIAGIVGVTVSNTEMVTINSATGQLGVASIPSGNISITGDSGGALTGSSFTFTGGTTGLTFAGSGTTETLGGTLIVSNGGTGVATMTTAYAPVCAGTTATGALQVASTGLSTSGYVLTSTGSGSLPTFQAVPSSSITWTDQAISFAAAKSNGYFCTAALTATLPASPSEGDTISFICTTTAIVLRANTGQTIELSTSVSTSAGTATNVAAGDAITLVYRTTGTKWWGLNSVGSWTMA